MTLPATTELVAVAWLKTVDGVPTGQVATSLPADFMTSATIAASGFVQVIGVGSPTDPYTPMRSSLVQVDVWMYNANQGKPPWNRAAVLAERITRAAESLSGTSVTLPSGYENAYVHSVTVPLEARRMLDVDERVARYTLDMIVNWRRS